MKILLLSLVIGLLNLATASAENEELCKLAKTVPTSSTALTVTPSYFISPDPNGQFVGIISNAGNQLVDLETGKMSRISGGVDPVYTPDGDYLTRPGGKFLDAGEIREKAKANKNTEDAKVIYSGGMRGVYQSTGVIEQGNKKIYRMIDDQDGMSYQEYERNGSSLKLTKLNSSAKKLCPGFKSDTPMISKDGKYVSIYNSDTLTTQIYNIEENVKNSNKPCKLVMDLGFGTGKVSFDAKNNQIAFHVDTINDQPNYFSGISGTLRKDSVVMKINIEKDAHGKETWTPTAIAKMNLTKSDAKLGTGSYYPRFTKDGSIVTVVQNKSGYGEYSLDVIPQENMNFKKYRSYIYSDAEIRRCTDKKEGIEVYAALALGSLWANICTDYAAQLRAKDLLFIPGGLDHNTCIVLVAKMWRGDAKTKAKAAVISKLKRRNALIYRRQDTLEKVTKDDMIAACPPNTNYAEGNEVNQVGTLMTAKPKNGAEVIEAKCVGCHESSREDRPFIDFDNPSMADINNMAQLVFSPHEKKKRMPPKEENQLEPEEKEMLKKYFLDVLSGAKEWKRPF